MLPRMFSAFGRLLPTALLLTGVGVASAQLMDDGFVTGQAARAWDGWKKALDGLLARQADAAEAGFAQLVADDASPMRLALMAERSQARSNLAGGLVLWEQDVDSGRAGDAAKAVYAKLQAGREQLAQADDGIYFSLVGQFPIAAANLEALAKSGVDPVALLEFVDAQPRREEVLLLMADHPIVGRAAREVLKTLAVGERMIKADPGRIQENIARLSGPPRQFNASLARLRNSGEYAAAMMIEVLRDPEQRDKLDEVMRALPQLGVAAVNPLTAALQMNDVQARQHIVQSLGRIGFGQAAPFLLKINELEQTPPELRSTSSAALLDLATRGVGVMTGATASQAFLWLANGYYQDLESLKADPRQDSANVWYWSNDLLQNIEVPTPIFNEVMCMRACEEALRLEPELKPALALWIAANFRREAQLPAGEIDATRGENYPSASYFAQAAGPEYCQMVLERAVTDSDPAVALGAIEALRKTAGPATLAGADGGRRPLAEALSFGNRMVRSRAALALGGAKPTASFPNDQNLAPALAETLMMFDGSRNALVVDVSDSSGNAVATALREAGYGVIVSNSLAGGLDQARSQAPGVDIIFLGSDTPPGLSDAVKGIRSEYRFASLPIIITAKPDQRRASRDLSRADYRVGEISVDSASEAILLEVARVNKAMGATEITPEVGQALAVEAADVLLGLAAADSPVVRLADMEETLLAALGAAEGTLRVKVAQVLAYVCSEKAQEAIAKVSLDASEPEDIRVAMFAALASAGKQCTGKLGAATIEKLVSVAEGEANLTLRAAASEALGALSLPGNPASTIIRNQYRG